MSAATRTNRDHRIDTFLLHPSDRRLRFAAKGSVPLARE
jgi:hypothetical protein